MGVWDYIAVLKTDWRPCDSSAVWSDCYLLNTFPITILNLVYLLIFLYLNYGIWQA